MKHILFLALVLLAGCNSRKPVIDVQTVEVPVLRVERCLDKKDIPARPGPLPKRPSSVSVAVDILLGKVRNWELYGDKADASMQACAR